MQPVEIYSEGLARRGQIVIPASIRRKFNIKDKVVVEADNNVIKIVPLRSLEDLYGFQQSAMREIALEISKEREEGARSEG